MNSPINIANCYIPPHQSFCSEDLPSITHNIQSPALILGDFNSWSPFWGSTYTNKRGSVIENFLISNNFFILNNGAPTHLSTHNTLTNVDLTFCSADLHPKCNWHVLDDLWGSDHFPIITNISTNVTIGKTISEKKFKTDKANWNLFASICDEWFKIWSFKNINHEVAMITKSIRFAANSAIPQTTARPVVSRPYWWNNNVANSDRKKCIRGRVLKTPQKPPT